MVAAPQGWDWHINTVVVRGGFCGVRIPTVVFCFYFPSSEKVGTDETWWKHWNMMETDELWQGWSNVDNEMNGKSSAGVICIASWRLCTRPEDGPGELQAQRIDWKRLGFSKALTDSMQHMFSRSPFRASGIVLGRKLSSQRNI